MATKEKKKMGRPTKFNDDIVKKMQPLYLRGFTDKEVCFVLGFTKQTLANYKKKYKNFFASIKDWKKIADLEVEKSLYERACGYSVPEEKIFCSDGRIIKAETTKHYPPDTSSMIFWLKNRQPEKWRDKQEVQHSGDDNFLQAIKSLAKGK